MIVDEANTTTTTGGGLTMSILLNIEVATVVDFDEEEKYLIGF